VKHPFLLYHWAPRSRRKSILKHGLRIRSAPAHGRKYCSWRTPWICTSPWPNHAWSLSATHGRPGKWWDLWSFWSDRVDKVAHARKEGWFGHPKEYRVMHNIRARNIWHVGERQFKGARYK